MLKRDVLGRKGHGKNLKKCWKYVSSTLRWSVCVFFSIFLSSLDFYAGIDGVDIIYKMEVCLPNMMTISSIFCRFRWSLIYLCMLASLVTIALANWKICMTFSKAESLFESDERFKAVERDRDRRDLFESHIEELKKEV